MKTADIKLNDDLASLVLQMGNNADKLAGVDFEADKLDRADLLNLYRSSWCAAKIVNIKPTDMCKNGITVDSEHKELIDDKLEELDIMAHLENAHQLCRLLGTSYMVLKIDNEDLLSEQLDTATIPKDSFGGVLVLDSEGLTPGAQGHTRDPFDDNWRLPEDYAITDSDVARIHNSRVLRFDCVKLPFREFQAKGYLSDSILQNLYQDIKNLTVATYSSAQLILESNVDVVQVENLMGLLQSREGQALVMQRFALAKRLKNNQRIMVMDAKESISNLTKNFAGLGPLIDIYFKCVTAGSDIPATRFLGSSAEGLSATGEGDADNYYDTCRSEQVRIYKPVLKKIIECILASAGYPGAEFTFEFNPLAVEDQGEKVERGLKSAQTDQIYLDSGVVDVETVLSNLKERDTYVISDKDENRILSAYAEQESEFENLANVEDLQETNQDPEEPQANDD